MTSTASNRRYELDWLRVLAILVVYLYHSTRFFNLGDWHLKNVNTYVWVEIWNVFATRWMMPLFFIISGASLFYAIEKAGGWRKFYADKFLRLMIPVLVASVTHGAMQVYLETVLNYRAPAAVLLLEHRSLDPELHARHIPRRDRFERLWRDLIQEGCEQDIFSCDEPAIVARALLGVMNWTITWYRPDGRLSALEIAEYFADLFLYGLLTRSA